MNLDEYFSHWRQVRDDLLRLVDLFSEQELAFTPFDGSMSAGEIMLHIAEAEDGWLRYQVTRELAAWPKYTLAGYPGRAEIKDLLSEVYARTRAFLQDAPQSDLERAVQLPSGGELTLGWIFWHVLEHEIHHRGELSLILGLLGREGLDV